MQYFTPKLFGPTIKKVFWLLKGVNNLTSVITISSSYNLFKATEILISLQLHILLKAQANFLYEQEALTVS